MEDAGTLIRACLEAFVSSDAHQQGKRLRLLAETSPRMFAEVSCALMRDVKDTQGYRYLLALLNSRGQLIEVLQMLCARDPGAAGAATNLAMRLIPGFDRLLSKGVESPKRPAAGSKKYDPEEFLRGVLQTVDGSLQLLSAVEAELRVQDPRIRSRMSMLAGRVARLWEQFGDLQADPDPRVRANAVESLWGVNSPMAAQSFAAALADPNHRVRANALVGLYLQGDPASLTGLLEMSRHADPLVRAAAAWGMGRTGDARFEPQLQEMRRSTDRHPMVIRNSLLSLSRLQRAEATSPHLPLRLTMLGLASTLCTRELRFQAEPLEGGILDSLSSTHVHLWNEGAPVWNAQLSRISPEPRPLSLLLPVRPEQCDTDVVAWAEQVSRSVPHRPEGVPWSLAYYSTEPVGRNIVRTGDILHLSEADALEGDTRLFDLPEFRLEAGSLESDAAGPVDEQTLPSGPFRLAAQLAGVRDGHDLLILFSELDTGLSPQRILEELRRVASERDVRVHAAISPAVATQIAAQIRRLSHATGGWCIEAVAPEHLHAALQTVVVSLSGYWLVRVEDAHDMDRLELRIRTGRHSGNLPLSPVAAERAA